jgi:hypothetical protein
VVALMWSMGSWSFGEKSLAYREFMKSGIRDIDIIATADIARSIPRPPLEKPYSAGAKK